MQGQLLPCLAESATTAAPTTMIADSTGQGHRRIRVVVAYHVCGWMCRTGPGNVTNGPLHRFTPQYRAPPPRVSHVRHLRASLQNLFAAACGLRSCNVPIRRDSHRSVRELASGCGSLTFHENSACLARRHAGERLPLPRSSVRSR